MTRFRDTTFDGDQLETFFIAVDRYLKRSARIEVIGGAAIAITHRVESVGTTDVDTFTPMTADLIGAVARAVVETSMNIPVTQAGIAQLPQNYEDRCERWWPHLARLEVWIVERHDLALSKALRGNEHDWQQLRAAHAAKAFAFELLVDRFSTEMDHVMGPPAQHRESFINLIDELFGAVRAATAKRRLQKLSS